jgi:hypothetical protein
MSGHNINNRWDDRGKVKPVEYDIMLDVSV